MVLELLNMDPVPESLTRVRELILCCLRLLEAGRRANVTPDPPGNRLKSHLRRALSKTQHPEIDMRHREIDALQQELHERAAEFWSPTGFQLDLYSMNGPRLRKVSVIPNMSWPSDELGDYTPYHALIDVVEDGSIGRIDRCGCGKYFFRGRKQKRCCSAECRIRNNQHSDKYREYQKDKQREYYWYNIHGTKPPPRRSGVADRKEKKPTEVES